MHLHFFQIIFFFVRIRLIVLYILTVLAICKLAYIISVLFTWLRAEVVRGAQK
jgi:hypothetical protein